MYEPRRPLNHDGRNCRHWLTIISQDKVTLSTLGHIIFSPSPVTITRYPVQCISNSQESDYRFHLQTAKKKYSNIQHIYYCRAFASSCVARPRQTISNCAMEMSRKQVTTQKYTHTHKTRIGSNWHLHLSRIRLTWRIILGLLYNLRGMTGMSSRNGFDCASNESSGKRIIIEESKCVFRNGFFFNLRRNADSGNGSTIYNVYLHARFESITSS